MEVKTSFDHTDSYYHPDYCPVVIITYEASYDVYWNVTGVTIESIHEVSQTGANREIKLSSVDPQDMKWAISVATKDAEERWEEREQDQHLAKGDLCEDGL